MVQRYSFKVSNLKKSIQIIYSILLFVLVASTIHAQMDSIAASTTYTPSTEQLKSIEPLIQDNSIYLKTNSKADSISYLLNGNNVTAANHSGLVKTDIHPDFKGELYKFGVEDGEYGLYHISMKNNHQLRIQCIPSWTSIIPPLLAILLALIFKEVLVSLFIGIWSGAFILGGMRLDSFYWFIASVLDVVQKYVLTALNDTGHLSVIIFSLLIGGMVAIISKNGGMAGVVQKLEKYAKNRQSTQFVTWFLGIAIFFDDYANTLIVGNTMRPVTDKFRISREKLSYLVDSTAAPVASVAFITTWIGAELGYISDGLANLGLDEHFTAYSVFISSIKYSYYSVFTIIFMFLLIKLRRDFGPMYKVEIRAITTGQISSAKTPDQDEPNMEDLSPVPNAKLNWLFAFLPILTVIITTIFGLIDSGLDSIHKGMSNFSSVNNTWGDIWSNIVDKDGTSLHFFQKLGLVIGSSDSYQALIWASLAGVIVALLLTVFSKTINLFNSMFYFTTGVKTMLPAILILVLAWSLALTTEHLHTAEFISNSLRGTISPLFLPGLIFILAALISFSTGSSWSTMAILFPIAIPTTYTLAIDAGLDFNHSMELTYNVIATVLAASVLGDHCSPISDTTILSSLASDCNHLDHVRTQLPYAMTVGSLSLVCVVLSTYFGGGLDAFGFYILGIIILYFVIKKFGKQTDNIEVE